MVQSLGYAAQSKDQPLAPFNFERRALRENDVFIEIQFCGVCHSDIFQAKDGWKKSIYPMVPGHEIVGVVKEIGPKVTKFKTGDRVGVGVMVDSCQECSSCQEHLEQYCEKGNVNTYNGNDYQTGEVTYGGYSNNIVVREEFVLSLPSNLDLAASAPLLCAGITTYSPLKHWKAGPGVDVGVVGLGGLGHMAVKLAKALGAKVHVFTTSEKKKKDAEQLGADQVILSTNTQEMEAAVNSVHLIINTVGAPIQLEPYLNCLKREGTMVMVGLPDDLHPPFPIGALVFQRKCLAGSLIGGIQETQEMLNFCGEHNIVSEIELIEIQKINEAFDRTERGDVKYRFVIDLKSLNLK